MRLRMMGYWSDGVDERRSDGVYGRWSNGVLEWWSDEIHFGPSNDLTIPILHYSITPLLNTPPHFAGTINVRNSKVRRPSRSRQSK
jgi:hypothetical protein